MSGSRKGVFVRNMYYILDPKFVIKKWLGTSACYLYRGNPERHFLKRETYEFLKKCDGKTDIEPCFEADILEVSGMIHPCEKGSVSLLPDQIKEYPNYYVRNVDWNLLDLCNYNCLHCFHAADNNMKRDSFSYEEAMRFLDEMVSCGITGVRLTGGEPTLYPYFREVLQGIKDRGIHLKTLITNGSRLDEELVSFIKKLHPDAEIRISFDGIGYHDWLRQHPGAAHTPQRARADARLFPRSPEAVCFPRTNINALSSSAAGTKNFAVSWETGRT